MPTKFGAKLSEELPTITNRTYKNVTEQGDTVLVQSQGPGLAIRVLAVHVMASADVTVTLKGGEEPISSDMPCGQNGGFVLPLNVAGWFQTGPDEALSMDISSAVSVGVNLLWQRVSA